MSYPPVILEIIYQYLCDYELAVLAPKYTVMTKKTAFEYAAAHEWFPGLHALYDDAYLERGLIGAANRGATGSTLQLLAWGARNISEAYIMAARHNRTDVMRILALFGPVDLKTALAAAASRGSIHAVLLIRETYCDPQTLLDISIAIESVVLTALALEWGATPSKRTLFGTVKCNSSMYYIFQPQVNISHTVLRAMVRYNRYEMFQHYLSIYPNLVRSAINYCQIHGQLLMHRTLTTRNISPICDKMFVAAAKRNDVDNMIAIYAAHPLMPATFAMAWNAATEPYTLMYLLNFSASKIENLLL